MVVLVSFFVARGFPLCACGSSFSVLLRWFACFFFCAKDVSLFRWRVPACLSAVIYFFIFPMLCFSSFKGGRASFSGQEPADRGQDRAADALAMAR